MIFDLCNIIDILISSKRNIDGFRVTAQNTILYHYTHWREGEAERQLSQLGTYTA